MQTTDIETIDLLAKEWFDKVNGKSYFSAQLTLNCGKYNQETHKICWQYGYGDSYREAGRQLLIKLGHIDSSDKRALWQWAEDNDIILRTHKIENCKKEDMIAFGE